MNRVQKLQNELEAIKKEIESLQTFRLTNHVRHLIRQLFGEQSHIKVQLRKLQATQESKEKERQERFARANKNRSEKMKRSWRYFKAIRENYPITKSLREIRSAFKKHKQGLETDVVDVIWRNPSP